MKDDQKRVESIEVDVERVAPLHVKVFAGVFQQVLVADEPGTENTKPHITSQKSQFNFKPGINWLKSTWHLHGLKAHYKVKASTFTCRYFTSLSGIKRDIGRNLRNQIIFLKIKYLQNFKKGAELKSIFSRQKILSWP